jgi:hypothetical protein
VLHIVYALPCGVLPVLRPELHRTEKKASGKPLAECYWCSFLILTLYFPSRFPLWQEKRLFFNTIPFSSASAAIFLDLYAIALTSRYLLLILSSSDDIDG